MFNAKQLLDQLMQATQQLTPPANNSDPAPKNHSESGLLAHPAITGALSGVGGGLLAGLLMNNKKIRKVTGNVAAYGGAAALGAIALTAYKNWQDNKKQSIPNPTQQQPALEFDTLPTEQLEEHSRIMLMAIVAAAKSDGQFDERERQLIRDQMNNADDDTVQWLQQEIKEPLDMNKIAALATTPEIAAEIYLASLVIIDEQNTQEKNYLDRLAETLELSPQLRMEISQQLRLSTE